MNVNDGYARNFILSRKPGVEANSKNLNDLEFKKANDNRIAAEQLAAAKGLGAKLDDSSVALTIKAEEGGRAFDSVSSKEVTEAIGDRLGIDVDRKKIMLSDPIEPTGSFEVPVKLHKDMAARLTVRIMEA